MRAVIWFLLAFAVWQGVFGMQVEIGTQRYLRLHAEYELGLVEEPSIIETLAAARRRGAIEATAWATLIIAAGLTTNVLGSRRKRKPRD